MVKVLVVGQTPPPYGGQTVMIQRFLQCEMQGVELLHVRMQLSTSMNEVTRFRVLKVLRLLPIIFRIFCARLVHRPQVLYYAPAGPFRLPMFRDLAILLSTRWLFSKTVFHFHAGGISELYDKLPMWQRWLFRRAYFGADAAIRIGETNPEDGKRLQAMREYIVPNGIEDPFPDMVLPRICPTISASRPLEILFMGILRESKGLLVLVEACGQLAARGVPFHLSIAGSPDSEEFVTQLRARIDELNLTRQITFVGVLTGKDKYAAFARADVFSMPTFYECETFGIVFVEAGACGTPVVATRWRGVPLWSTTAKLVFSLNRTISRRLPIDWPNWPLIRNSANEWALPLERSFCESTRRPCSQPACAA